MTALVQHGSRTRCALCEAELNVQTDDPTTTCRTCGATLRLESGQAGITTRHAGEALKSARANLEVAALERAIATLRARRTALAPLAKVRSRTIWLRRVLSWVALAAWAVGLVCLLTGQAVAGGLLFLVGLAGFMLSLLARRDAGAHSMVAEMRQVRAARQASAELRSLDREIDRRQRLLDELAATKRRR
jgi:hypothetical protein